MHPREFLGRTANRVLAAFGLRLARLPVTRFQGMESALEQLARAGFDPTVVIDGGANRGTWAAAARRIFPRARLWLVEPQLACADALAEFTRRTHGAEVRRAALTAPGHREVTISSDDGGAGTFITGYVEENASTDATPASPYAPDLRRVRCPAATLDELFADRVTESERVLLKLDLEGHEVAALTGAERLLSRVEVVVSETAMYSFGGGGQPHVMDLIRLLDGRGFVLYDVAALSARPRDCRLRQADFVFVHASSPLLRDDGWD